MRMNLGMCLLLVGAALACAPKDECNGALYYDSVTFSCRPCPKDGTFKNGVCKCKASYDLVSGRCVLMAGATPPSPRA